MRLLRRKMTKLQHLIVAFLFKLTQLMVHRGLRKRSIQLSEGLQKRSLHADLSEYLKNLFQKISS